MQIHRLRVKVFLNYYKPVRDYGETAFVVIHIGSLVYWIGHTPGGFFISLHSKIYLDSITYQLKCLPSFESFKIMSPFLSYALRVKNDYLLTVMSFTQFCFLRDPNI